MSICDVIEEGAFTVEVSKFIGFESWKCCKMIQVCCSMEEKDPCNKCFNFSHLTVLLCVMTNYGNGKKVEKIST